MKIAVSNIAWPTEQDRTVADAFASAGVEGIEVAPTKIWPSPLEATNAQIDDYRRFWEGHGLPIVAAQALLFGRPELTLFTDRETRRQTLDYLRGIVRLCGRLGAQALVFGSPKNRRAGDRHRAAVWDEAIDFFRQLAQTAAGEGTRVVVEANPREYGADFITHAAEAMRLVRSVDHPGCQLHLDAACMKLADDDPGEVLPHVGDILAHFHASEPFLAPIGQGTVDHARVAQALAAAKYAGWVSIEMRQLEPFDMQPLVSAVRSVQGWYA
jgi:sugar phosphate isomerase/epimerase